MKLIRKIVSAAAAVACFAAMAVTSFADYTYSLDDKQLVSEVQADSYTINGAEGTFEKNNLQAAETDDAISMRFSVFNEYLSKTWWDSDDVTVSVDVKLETEGVDVMGFIAGFDRSWKWINPSNYVPLEYGKWVTVSETGKHFQEIWGKRGPNQFMFQVRSNWDAGDQGYVKVSVRNFRIEGQGNVEGAEVTEASTTSATTTQTTTAVDTEPAETTVSEPADVHTSEPEDAVTAESTVTESTPAETTAAAEVSEPEKPAESATSAVVTAATEAAAPDMSQIVLERPDTGKDIASVIIIVVVAVVVVIAAVVIGYVIYKKKKFY